MGPPLVLPNRILAANARGLGVSLELARHADEAGGMKGSGAAFLISIYFLPATV